MPLALSFVCVPMYTSVDLPCSGGASCAHAAVAATHASSKARARSLLVISVYFTGKPYRRQRVEVNRESFLLLEIDGDVPPHALIEPQHAQDTARGVADEDRDPDIDGIECRCALNHETDAERDDNLRHD